LDACQRLASRRCSSANAGGFLLEAARPAFFARRPVSVVRPGCPYGPLGSCAAPGPIRSRSRKPTRSTAGTLAFTVVR